MERWSRELRAALTFLLVVIGWVLFRASDFRMASGLLGKMFWPSSGVVPPLSLLLPALVLAAGLAHFGANTFEMQHKWSPRMRLVLVAMFALCLAVIYGGEQAPFLYYQF
jgi:hypothetical protein